MKGLKHSFEPQLKLNRIAHYIILYLFSFYVYVTAKVARTARYRDLVTQLMWGRTSEKAGERTPSYQRAITTFSSNAEKLRVDSRVISY